MRPLFSIIIPCHNSAAYIADLLKSIVNQGIDKNEMEVIIVDDNSTDNFIEVAKMFNNDLNIKYTTTEGVTVHCPGNTRQCGLDIATGEWITFIDHDDEFIQNALKSVKEIIKEDSPLYYISTFFNEILPQEDLEKGLKPRTFSSPLQITTWLHGKFYNKDRLIDAFDIHFEKNLASHEDLYFNTKVLIKLFANGLSDDLFFHCYDIYTYKWNYNQNSLSHLTNLDNIDEYTYIEKYFCDWLYAASANYIEIFNQIIELQDEEKEQKIIVSIIDTLLIGYFYYQAMCFRLPANKVIIENLIALRSVKTFLLNIGITDEDLIKYVYSNAFNYRNIRANSTLATGPFIEKQSFLDFYTHL